MKIIKPRYDIVKPKICQVWDKKDVANLQSFGAANMLWESAGAQDVDLGFVKAVLTTEGGNSNFHHFFPEELIKAVATPLLKPFNVEHDKNLIRGVIYDSAIAHAATHEPLDLSQFPKDENGMVQIPEELRPIEIVIACAVYRALFPEFYDSIVQEVAEGKTPTMSMEVWFTDYDYVIGDRVIARTEKNWHIDQFIGSEYDGGTVFKGFRNITFGGVAKVENPAQEKSIFLAVAANNKAKKDAAMASTIIADSRDRAIFMNDGTHWHTERNPFGMHAHTEEEWDILWPIEDPEPRYMDTSLIDRLGGHIHNGANPFGLHKHLEEASIGGAHMHVASLDDLLYGSHSHPVTVEIEYASVDVNAQRAAAAVFVTANRLNDTGSESENALKDVNDEVFVKIVRSFAVQSGIIDSSYAETNFSIAELQGRSDLTFPLDDKVHVEAVAEILESVRGDLSDENLSLFFTTAEKMGISINESAPAEASDENNLFPDEGRDEQVESNDTQKQDNAAQDDPKEPQTQEEQTANTDAIPDTDQETANQISALEAEIEQMKKDKADSDARAEAAETELQELKSGIEADKRTEARLSEIEETGFTFRDDDHRQTTAALVRDQSDDDFESFKTILLGATTAKETETTDEGTATEQASEQANASEDVTPATGKATASLDSEDEPPAKQEAKIKAFGDHRV